MSNDCVGLRGAKAIGDRRVASLAQFSWKNRHKSGHQVMTVLDEIGNERARQIGIEGFGPKHDDCHTTGEIALAAAAYAYAATISDTEVAFHKEQMWGRAKGTFSVVAHLWPWETRWFKPKGKRANLIRAGALIVAEIERMDRVMPSQDQTK